MGQELPMGDISSAEIVWGYGESGPLTLSPFYGAVTLSITETMNDVQEEAHGDASVDSVKGGTVIELTCPMARSSLDQLKVAIDGPISGNEITIKNKAGCNVRDRLQSTGRFPETRSRSRTRLAAMSGTGQKRLSSSGCATACQATTNQAGYIFITASLTARLS